MIRLLQETAATLRAAFTGTGEGTGAKMSWRHLAPLFFGHAHKDDSPFQLTPVFNGLHMISDSIATMPICPYETTEQGRNKLVDHPTYKLLEKEPNQYDTAFRFWKFIEWNRQAWGNGYALIIFNEATARPEELIPLRSWNVTPYWDKANRIIWYWVSHENLQGWVRQEDMLHFRGPSFDGIAGVSGIQYCRMAVETATSIQSYGKHMFQNGGSAKGFIQFPQELGEESFKRLKQEIQETFHGSDNAGKIPVLEGGGTYQDIGINPEDAEFIASRKFNTEEVARMLNIPKVKLKDMEDAHFNNVEQMDLQYLSQTLLPLVRDIENEVDKKLLLESEKRNGLYHEFNMNAILRADMNTRRQFYSSGVTEGWLTRNDVRLMENHNKLETGDQELVPTHTQLARQLQLNADKTQQEIQNMGERNIGKQGHQILKDLHKFVNGSGN